MNRRSCEVLYAKYNSARRPDFRITTELCENSDGLFIRKRAGEPAAKAHLENILRNGAALQDYYHDIKMIPCEGVEEGLKFPFIKGETFAEKIDVSRFEKDSFIAQVNERLDRVLRINEKFFVPFESSDAFEAVFGKVDIGPVPALNPANIDSLFTNFIENDTSDYCIDCEWVFYFPVPVEYIKYRIIRYLYLNEFQNELGGASLEEMLAWFGFSGKVLETFWEMEKSFQQYIHGEKWKYIYTEYYKKENLPIGDIDQEIQALKSDNSFKAGLIHDKDVHIGNLENMIHDRDNHIDSQNGIIHDKDVHIENLGNMIHDKDVHIGNLENMIHDKDVHIENLGNMIHDKDVHIDNLGNMIHDKDVHIGNLNGQIQNLTLQYQTVTNAFFWRITKPARAMMDGLKRFVRKNESVYIFCRTGKDVVRHGFKYAMQRRREYYRDKERIREATRWPSEEMLARQREESFPRNIRFSILVPLFNTPENYLSEMIQSVQDQTYANWELCLADGSDSEHGGVRKYCMALARKDNRIRYRKLKENKGISENTNACIKMASGDYFVLFDHDDILHPSALYENMKVICRDEADFIYSDENTFHETPQDAYCPHFKPDYAPDTLRSYNYICHLTVFKKSLLDEIGGGFRSQFDGSQDYDMILRLTEKARRIAHIPKILYFWRGHAGSVASDVSAKAYTVDAAKAALTEHLDRVGLKGTVLDSSIPSTYRIKYGIEGNPLISIVIPNMDHMDDLKKCIDSILGLSTWKHFEIIVVENNSKQAETFEYYRSLKDCPEIRIVTWEGVFNFSAICNFGAKAAKGDYILLLNNDIQVITPDWMEQMLMFAQRKDVGAAGAMLYYPDDTIQHAGVILGIGGVAGHSHKYFKRGDYGYASRLTIAQNLSAVTAACCLIPRRVWEQVRGLDEGYAVAFNDVDLCLRIREAGYLIVWTPYAELYHFESKSRGYEDTAEKRTRFKGEIDRFFARWSDALARGDPYYSPNLTLEREDFSFR